MTGGVELLDGGIDPEADEVLLDCSAAGLTGVRLGIGVAGGRPWRDAPVVQHRRDVVNRAGTFGDAQDQVVVLRPVEAVAEATDLGDQ